MHSSCTKHSSHYTQACSLLSVCKGRCSGDGSLYPGASLASFLGCTLMATCVGSLFPGVSLVPLPPPQVCASTSMLAMISSTLVRSRTQVRTGSIPSMCTFSLAMAATVLAGNSTEARGSRAGFPHGLMGLGSHGF